MRTILTTILIFSLTFANLASAAESVNFKPNPVVTVELEERSFSWSFYVYGAIGLVALYTVASLKFQTLRNLNKNVYYRLASQRKTGF